MGEEEKKKRFLEIHSIEEGYLQKEVLSLLGLNPFDFSMFLLSKIRDKEIKEYCKQASEQLYGADYLFLAFLFSFIEKMRGELAFKCLNDIFLALTPELDIRKALEQVVSLEWKEIIEILKTELQRIDSFCFRQMFDQGAL